MTQENNYDEKEPTATASDAPHGDGTVSDEDVNAIGEHKGSPPAQGGQDHSTEDHEKEMPTSGVGGVQDSSTIRENIAHIDD
ncbi:hypothetical protein BH10ACI1_BH10ACI1_02390 [soil metagenome]